MRHYFMKKCRKLKKAVRGFLVRKYNYFCDLWNSRIGKVFFFSGMVFVLDIISRICGLSTKIHNNFSDTVYKRIFTVVGIIDCIWSILLFYIVLHDFKSELIDVGIIKKREKNTFARKMFRCSCVFVLVSILSLFVFYDCPSLNQNQLFLFILVSDMLLVIAAILYILIYLLVIFVRGTLGVTKEAGVKTVTSTVITINSITRKMSDIELAEYSDGSSLSMENTETNTAQEISSDKIKPNEITTEEFSTLLPDKKAPILPLVLIFGVPAWCSYNLGKEVDLFPGDILGVCLSIVSILKILCFFFLVWYVICCVLSFVIRQKNEGRFVLMKGGKHDE